MSLRFRPRLWPTLGALIGLALLLALGTWQYRRYEEKVVLEELREQRLEAPPTRVDDPAERDLQDLNYRKVTLRGRLDAERTILFKHRQYEKSPGYWLANPLLVEDSDVAVIVNRGWVPFEKGPELAKTLTPEAPEMREWTGLLYVLPQNVPDTVMRDKFKRGDAALDAEITQWNTYDIEAIQNALPYNTLEAPAVLVLDESHSGDPFPLASTDTITKPYMTAERHQSYFIFWYTTAGALVMLWLAASCGVVGSFRARASELEQDDA